MKKSKHTEIQIIGVLKQIEAAEQSRGSRGDWARK